MTNGIDLAALGFGGIDTSSIVSGLVAVAQQPVNQLQTEQQNINSAQSTISGFSSDLSALKSAAVALSDPSQFNSLAASSSDPSVVATVNGTSAPGQWSVSVSAVAQDQRSMSNGVSSTTTALGLVGNLNIQGAQGPIAISATDTMSDIAGKISDAITSAGLPLQVSTVYDGSQYHLLVTGLNTGKANAFTIDESSLASTGSYSLGFTNTQNAQDASLTVGGVAITSPSNQISNAIPGVTLAVTQPTTSPATVSITSSPSAIVQQVQAFVSAYNTVVNNGHSIAGYGTQAASNSLLQGDDGVRSSLDELASLMAEVVPGTSGTYTTLGSVGLTLNDDGTLTLDSGALESALDADPTSVERLFVTDSSNGSQGIMATIGSTVDALSTNAGNPLQAEMDSFSSRSSQISTEITAMQQRITDYQTQLQNEFTQMNTTLEQYKQIANSLNSLSDSSSSSSSSSNGVL